MKVSYSTIRNHGFNLIELFIVLATLMLLAAALLPALVSRPRVNSGGIQCINNVKQIGLAYRVWEGDNGDKYPMAVSETNGGSMEFVTGPSAFRNFQVMSNELSTPKILFCPNETDRARSRGTNWNINNSNISYFVGVDAAETNAQMILSGDRNLTNGTPVKNGLLELSTNQLTGWTTEIHKKVGNVLLADGSVRQFDIPGLRDAVAHTGLATNRLQMPILSP